MKTTLYALAGLFFVSAIWKAIQVYRQTAAAKEAMKAGDNPTDDQLDSMKGLASDVIAGVFMAAAAVFTAIGATALE